MSTQENFSSNTSRAEGYKRINIVEERFPDIFTIVANGIPIDSESAMS